MSVDSSGRPSSCLQQGPPPASTNSRLGRRSVGRGPQFASGYGKATAELFLERGWNVVATMRQPKPDIFGFVGPNACLLVPNSEM